MADPLIIPTSPDDPFYSQTSELNGVDYLLVFLYNQREGAYYLSLKTEDGVEIVSGLKLVCNTPLLAYHRSANTPPGELMVLSSVETDESPPDVGELGPDRRCLLYYLPTDG